MKRSFVIHPFLFAIFPILFLFSYNIEQASFYKILLPLATVLIFSFFLVLFLRYILKNKKKSGIIASISLILFFSYGHIYDIIQDRQISSALIGHKVLLSLWFLLFIFFSYLVIRKDRGLHKLNNTFNLVASLLIILSFINIGIFELKTINTPKDTITDEYLDVDVINLEDNYIPRDIYYIIFDEYSSLNTLKEVYDYDNQEFNNYLEDKGFYIASESNSNYPLTFLSLTSSLNMDYLDYLTDNVGLESRDRTIPYQMIEDNKVMRFLKSRGYKFIHFGSGWGATDSNKYADWNVKCDYGNEFITMLIQTTMLHSLDKYFVKSFATERILCTFDKLSNEVHKIEYPKFVFAHILAPYPHFLSIKDETTGQREYYINRVNFVNEKIKVFVDEILSNTETPPIIILQADTGTSSLIVNSDDGWDNPTKEMLKERMGIFNAYYLPEYDDNILYDSITPVNTFRVVFNSYFSTNHSLLNDYIYFSSYDQPYNFINVTEEVRP